MKKMQQSYVSFVSMALVLGASFAACGGLDARKVTRGSDDTTDKGGEGNDPDPSAGAGGMDSSAGGGKNETPFGGDKGYEGGAPPVVDGPPTVEQVNPAADADDAEPTDNIGLRFSEGLDASTVTPDSIKIMDGDVEVDGDLSYEGIDALFEPTRRLSLLATYDISVSTDVTDAGGIAMAEPFTSKFTVRDGVWGKPTQAFDEQEKFGGLQDIAIAPNGNALALYTKRSGSTQGASNIYARWYRVSGGWSAEQPLETYAGGISGYNVKGAVSEDGDAIAAWWIFEGGSWRLRASRFVNGSWEAEPQYVEQMAATALNDNTASEISVAIGAGRVAIAWFRNTYMKMAPNYYYYDFMVSATTVDGAWPDYPSNQYSTTYQSPTYSQVRYPRVVIDNKGNALATFVDTSTDVKPTYGGGVYYSRKPAGDNNWQYPVKIEGTSAANLQSAPALATDGSGAMLVWQTYDESNVYKTLASRYTVAKQFVAPIEIGDPELQNYANFAPDRARERWQVFRGDLDSVPRRLPQRLRSTFRHRDRQMGRGANPRERRCSAHRSVRHDRHRWARQRLGRVRAIRRLVGHGDHGRSSEREHRRVEHGRAPHGGGPRILGAVAGGRRQRRGWAAISRRRSRRRAQRALRGGAVPLLQVRVRDPR